MIDFDRPNPLPGRNGSVPSAHCGTKARRARRVTVARLWMLSCTFVGSLLAQPTLRITAPADGTVVHPGQSLTVTVEASPPGAFLQVILFGSDRFGFGPPLLAPPYRFTVQIPSHIVPGEYRVTADGATAPGQGAASDPITLVVERTDTPASLRVHPSLLRLSVGGKGYLRVTGVFSDGQSLDLTQSTHTVYTSGNPSVVAVEGKGVITAKAPGSAKVTVTNGVAKFEVPVTVSVGKGR